MNNVQSTIDRNNYKQIADKIKRILSSVKNNTNASAKRWVWELMQNAKDIDNIYGEVSVEIEFDGDQVEFRHNGDPFQVNNILGLIQQVSSKSSTNEDESQTGKFGTGFICTHLLSDIITVKGVIDHEGLYRNFTLKLDRSGNSSEELMPKIEEALCEIKELDNIGTKDSDLYPLCHNYIENRKQNDFDTKFIYKLTTDSKKNSAIKGIEDLENTLPFTLALHKKIDSVRVIDKTKNIDITYKSNTVPIDSNIYRSTISYGDQKNFLSYKTDEITLMIEIEKIDDKIILKKRISDQPVLYRDFPLIGSDKFHFPYVLHGARFEPTEPRDDIHLNGDEENYSAQSNRKIMEKAIETVMSFNEWLIAQKAENTYLIASSKLPELTVQKDDNLVSWFQQLQKNWRSKLKELNIVETEHDGYKKLTDVQIPYWSNNEKVNTAFYNLVEPLLTLNKLPKRNQHIKWIEAIGPNNEYNNWDYSLKYDKEKFLKDITTNGGNAMTIDALSAKLNKSKDDTYKWLNDVISFLIKTEEHDILEKKAILPNQNGVFCELSSLESDNTYIIQECFKDFYNQAFKTDIRNRLIDNNIITTELKISTFNFEKLSNELNNFIKNDKNNIADRKYISFQLISKLDKLNSNIEYRRNFYNIISEIQELPVIQEFEGNVPDKLWEEADNLIFSITPKETSDGKSLANLSTNFFRFTKTEEESILWLNSFNQFCKENNRTKENYKYAIFPNQKGVFCLLNDSIHFDNNIPDEFKDVLLQNQGENMYESLLDTRLKGFNDHSPWDITYLKSEIRKLYDKSNSDIQLEIAFQIVSIIPESQTKCSDLERLYDFAKLILPNKLSEKKYVRNSDSFSWGFAIKKVLDTICGTISISENIEGFKKLNSAFNDFSDEQAIEWIDNLIKYIVSYKNGQEDKIIKEDHGIWLNQKNDFCKFDMLYRDDNIAEILKDLANNPIVNKDYREHLFTTKSIHQNLIVKTIHSKEIATQIDDTIEAYGGNKQDPNFAKLIFELGKFSSDERNLVTWMKFYNDKKAMLIVGSIGEGDTMNIIGKLVQDPDKLNIINNIIDNYSMDQLEELTNKNSNISISHSFFAKFPGIGEITEERIMRWLDLEAKSRIHTNDHHVRTEDEIIRDNETGRKGEQIVFEKLNQFKNSGSFESVVWNNQFGESGGQFDIVATRTNNTQLLIEVKSTTTTIKQADTISMYISQYEWGYINRINDESCYYLARVFDVNGEPEIYFLEMKKALK